MVVGWQGRRSSLKEARMFEVAHSPGLSQSDERGRRRESYLQRVKTPGEARGLAGQVYGWEGNCFWISHQTTLRSLILPSRWTKQIKLLYAKHVLETILVNCLSVMRRRWRLGLNTTLDYLTLCSSGRATYSWRSFLWMVSPPPPVYMDPIHKALRKMKCGEAAGPLGIIAGVLKAAGELGIELLTELTDVVFCNGEITRD